jgi:hypothetical protein
MGAAVNWYISNGFTGAHSGTPTIFVWPGNYSAETSAIEIPSDVELNIQLSGGVIIPYTIATNGLFYFKGSNGVLNLTGQDSGDTARTTYPSSEFSGTGKFVQMDSQTDNAYLNIDGVSIRSNTTPLLITPGTTGSGDSDIYINNSRIENYGVADDNPAIDLDGPLYVGIDNSSILNQYGGGDQSVGVVRIGANGARFNLNNSVVWQKGVNNASDTSAIAASIGSTTSSASDYYITISGNTFYSENPQGSSILYDYDATSTGIVTVHTNNNNVHNMVQPASAGDGTFLITGPGALQLKYLQPPTW